MALTVGTLVGYLRVEDGEFNSTLDRGERRFAGAGAAIGRAVKAVAAAGGAALVAGGAIGLATASQLEQAEIGFTTMLGSGQAARAFLADLASFAAKTPFELPQLQKAASSLVSVGVEADRVIPIMTVLGDATAAMGTGGEGVERATRALQQMAVKGKVSGEEMLQLAEAGIPAWDALAASLGVTTAKAQEMVTAGEVSVEEFYTAIETRSGTSLARVSGMMDVQSQSMAGLWSTLKDTVSLGLASTIQPLIPLIKDGLGFAIRFASDSMPMLATGIETVIDAVSGFIDRIRNADSAEISDSFASMRESAGELVPVVQDLIAELPSFTDVLDVGATVLGFLADNSDKLADALPFLAAGFLLVKGAQSLGNVAAVASLPIQAAQVVSNFALASALRASAAASTSSAAQQVAASGAVQASTLRTTMSAAAAAARVVAGWVLMGTQALLHAARVAAAWLIAMGPIGLVIAAVVGLVALIVANWDTVVRITTQVWSAVWGFIKSIASAIASWVSARISDVIGFFAMLGSLPGKVGAWFLGVKTAAITKLGELVTWVKGLPGRIVSALGNLGSTLLQAGKDILQGLWDGIKAKFGQLKDWLGKQLGSGILGAVADFLGIGSPSKRFRDEVGRWIPPGIAAGVAQGKPALNRAMRDLVTVPSVRLPSRVRGGDGGFARALASGGLHVENLTVKAFSDRFSINQVMDDLAFHGAS